MKKKWIVAAFAALLAAACSLQCAIGFAEGTAQDASYALSGCLSTEGIAAPFAPVAGTELASVTPMTRQTDYYDAPGAWNQFGEEGSAYADGTKVIFWNGETQYIGVSFAPAEGGVFDLALTARYAHADAADGSYDGAKLVIYTIADNQTSVLGEKDGLAADFADGADVAASAENVTIEAGESVYFVIGQKNAAFDTYKMNVTAERVGEAPEPEEEPFVYDLAEDYKPTGLVEGSRFSFVTGDAKSELGPTVFVAADNPYYEGVGNSGIWQQLAVGEVDPLVKNGIFSRFWGINRYIGTRFSVPQDGMYHLTFGVKWASAGAVEANFDGVKVSMDKQDGTSVLPDTVLGFQELKDFKTHYFTADVRLKTGETVDFNLNGFNNAATWHSWDTYQVIVKAELLSDTYTSEISGGDSVYIGETLALSNVVQNGGADEEGFSVEWSIDDEEIAEISADGVLTGKSRGQVVVTARSVKGTHLCIATHTVEVKTREVIVTVNGAASLKAGESSVYEAEVLNSEQAPVFGTTTPDILSVEEATGKVTALRSGIGVVTAQVGGVTAEKIVTVEADFSAEKTLWDFEKDIPYEQGENSFYIVYGAKGDAYLTDNSYLLGLSGDSCFRSTDANQWKGSSNDVFATVGTTFMLPGDEVMGIRFQAVADDTYHVNFKFAQTPGNLNGFADKEDALRNGFDGSILGVVLLRADGTMEELGKWDCDYDYFIDAKTSTTIFDDEIALKQGESLLFYVNCRERYEYDQLDFSLKIGAKTYEGPLWINEKPEVSGQTQSFNKSAPADVVISADLKGYDPISIKIAGKEVGADSYVYEAGKLTIKKEFLATIGNGLKTVEISTEKGTVTCRLQISGDNSVQEQTPSNPSFPAWGIVLICVGAAVVAGGIAVFVIVRKRKNGKKQ